MGAEVSESCRSRAIGGEDGSRGGGGGGGRRGSGGGGRGVGGDVSSQLRAPHAQRPKCAGSRPLRPHPRHTSVRSTRRAMTLGYRNLFARRHVVPCSHRSAVVCQRPFGGWRALMRCPSGAFIRT